MATQGKIAGVTTKESLRSKKLQLIKKTEKEISECPNCHMTMVRFEKTGIVMCRKCRFFVRCSYI